MRAVHNAAATSIAAAAILVSLVSVAWAQAKESTERKTGAVDREATGRPSREAELPMGIKVTLSVYSGRPNPSWTLEPGPERDRVVALVRDLKTTDAKLFNYEEWNRLGYASFWLSARGLSGLPSGVHIWRDMAFVPSKEGKGLQAIGASKLYEMLVRQAEAKGHAEFFLNYRKQPPAEGATR